MTRAAPERKRKPKAPQPSEDAIHIAIRAALVLHGVRSRHAANDGKRSIASAMRLKRLGMVAGDPDLRVWMPRLPGWPLVGFLEVKSATGRLTPAQQEEIAALRADGFPVAVVRSVDEALAALREWGWIK
ncbi:MAG: VRR-NUC domain-containing protein [Pseudomonadota bacterium]|jgi:hypothetical protein